MADKDAAAEKLIAAHFQLEPGLVQIYRVHAHNEADPDEPIKLVEVNTDTIATGSFEAYGFAPSRETPFPTLIAEVTPDELLELQRQGRWPSAWDLSRAKKFVREAA
jgi:hypothetical protein